MKCEETGKRLQDFRQLLNLTQKEFAKPLKVSRSALSHYETGSREIPTDFVFKVMQVYGFNLLQEDDHETSIGQEKEVHICKEVTGVYPAIHDPESLERCKQSAELVKELLSKPPEKIKIIKKSFWSGIKSIFGCNK